MPPGSLSLTCSAGEIVLLAQRAAYLPQHQTLLVADAHLGKAQSFRRLGVPVPSGTTHANLQCLSALLQDTGARRLIFLGDMVHAARGCSAEIVDAIRTWRKAHARVYMALVRGNHDAPQLDFLAWGVEPVDEPFLLGGWALCHHPQTVTTAYALCGHLHPCVTVGRSADRLRLPCFHFGAEVGVLPAFGGFTGMHAIHPQPGDCVAAVADGQVRRVPTPLLPRRAAAAAG